jgi:hypothetical protein
MITRTLDKHGIACVLDLVEGSMTVKTTRKTFDPAAILKARDLIKLLSRSVPAQQVCQIGVHYPVGVFSWLTIPLVHAGSQNTGGRRRVRHCQNP